MRRMMQAVLAAVSLGSGACTLLYNDDATKKQCVTDEDCQTLLGRSDVLTCEANVCVFREGISSLDAGGPQADAAIDAAADGRVACKNTKDCGAGERCGFDGFCYDKWGCLDNDPDWLDNVKQEFTYEASLRSLQSPDDVTLLGDVSAIACSAADPECERPKVPEGVATVSADKVLKLPFTGVGTSGFVGVIRMLAEVPKDIANAKAVLPGYFHFTGENPLVSDVVGQDRVMLIDTGTYGLLGALAGTAGDSTAGTNVFLIYDCGGQSAADISVTPSAGVVGYRFIPIQGETTPVIDATATTEDGLGILINIPPGSQVFLIKDEKLGRVISDKFSFNVRGNAINYVQYYPRFSGLKAWLDEQKRKKQSKKATR